jgi:hypothetical protein
MQIIKPNRWFEVFPSAFDESIVCCKHWNNKLEVALTRMGNMADRNFLELFEMNIYSKISNYTMKKEDRM